MEAPGSDSPFSVPEEVDAAILDALGLPVEQQAVVFDGLVARFPGEGEKIRARQALAEGGGDESSDLAIGRYRLVALLGGGGMGRVHLAYDPQLERHVAIKLMMPFWQDSATKRRRFVREATAVAAIRHPNLCRVLEAKTDGEQPYIVMDYIPGRSLEKRLRDAELGLGPVLPGMDGQCEPGRIGAATPCSTPAIHRILLFIEKAARALHELHGRGLVHRDIKPGNVMVTDDGEPVVVDFGLLLAERAEPISREHEAPGTPEYKAPEQFDGSAANPDARADVYSLGLLLHECLTLRRPFGEGRRVNDLPEQARTLNRAISKDVRTVLEAAIENEARRRYGSMLEFAEDLRRVREGHPPRAMAVGLLGSTARWAKRNPWVAAFIALLTIGGATAITTITLALQQARSQESLARDRLTTTLSLVEDMVVIAKDMRGVPGSVTAQHELVDACRARLDPLIAAGLTDHRVATALGFVYRELAVIKGSPWSQNLGEHADAAVLLETAERMLQSVPASHSKQYGLAGLRGARAVVQLMSGNAVGAKACAEDGLRILSDLEQRPPAKHQRAVLLMRRGAAELALHEYDAAIRDLEQALGEARALRSIDNDTPVREEALRVIREALWLLGDAHERGGQLERALTIRKDSLKLARPASAGSAPTALQQRDIAIANSRLAGTLSLLGRWDAANKYRAKALLGFRKIYAMDPGSARTGLDLVIEIRRAFDAAVALGQVGNCALLEEALGITEQLFRDPRAQFLHAFDHFAILSRLAKHHRRAGDVAEAVRYLKIGEGQAESLVSQFPRNAGMLHELAAFRGLLGVAHDPTELNSLKDAATAIRHYTRASEARASLVRVGHQPVANLRGIVTAQNRIGGIHVNQRAFELARKAIDIAVAACEELRARGAKDRAARDSFSVTQEWVGTVCRHLGDFEGAVSAFVESERVLDLGPESSWTTADCVAVAFCRYKIALAYEEQASRVVSEDRKRQCLQNSNRSFREARDVLERVAGKVSGRNARFLEFLRQKVSQVPGDSRPARSKR